MSAVPPIAIALVHRNELTRSAKTCHGPLPCACESDVALPQSCQRDVALAVERLSRERTMKRFFLAALVSVFALGSAMAQETCESKAVGKDGRPLAGAAKTSFLQKCKRDACETKAVGSDGRKLSGAAKTSFMKKCEAGA